MSLDFISEETKLSIERIKELEKRLETAQKEIKYYQEKTANLMNEIVGLDNRLDRIRQLINEQIDKTKSSYDLCESMIARIKKEFSEKELTPETRHRLHDLTEKLDVWRTMRDLAKERLERLNSLRKATEE